MLRSELDGDEKPEGTAQIEERFRNIFKREMTLEERRSFFMPDEEWEKSSG